MDVLDAISHVRGLAARGDRIVFEFVGAETRVVGGDYGQLHLEGGDSINRQCLDAIVAATRRGADGARVIALVVECDCSPLVLETRDAGLAGTPEAGAAASELRATSAGTAQADPADEASEG